MARLFINFVGKGNFTLENSHNLEFVTDEKEFIYFLVETQTHEYQLISLSLLGNHISLMLMTHPSVYYFLFLVSLLEKNIEP